jgi:hypothetical protein
MFRTIICAAIAAAFVAFTAPVTAQAGMVNPGLNSAAAAAPAAQTPMVQKVDYWRWCSHHRRCRVHRRRAWHRRWRHHHRHCWHERVRVRHHHHWVWRTIRRCRYY